MVYLRSDSTGGAACGNRHPQNKLPAEGPDHVTRTPATPRPIRREIMKQQLRLAGFTLALALSSQGAVAQEKIKVGVIVTLSGPAAGLGQQARDGFALAV